MKNAQTENATLTPKPISGGYLAADIHKASGGAYIVTAAQNNTDLHAEFFDALVEYAGHIGAELIVCPILYNKNGWLQPEDKTDLWFDPRVRPYLLDDRVYLSDDVLLLGNAHVLPTAKRPLTGFADAGNQGDWLIIPASKIALECQAALKGETGKTLLSTGTVTQKNYIARKAGMVAELTHNFGAVIVEPFKKPRSIEWRGGEFFDFNGADIYASQCAGAWVAQDTALIFGDIHAEKCATERMAAMIGIAEKIKPSLIVTHDTLDFESRNHHNKKDPFFLFKQDNEGNTVKSDIALARRVLRLFAVIAPIHVVLSNHDRALDRWLSEADWRHDMVNASQYLKLALAKIRAIKAGLPFDCFAAACGKIDRVAFGTADQSRIFNGVELGHHGDKAANGARGSVAGFAKLGVPMVIGHSHTPAICGAVYQVGVGGDLDMGYNEGASSWRHAHCAVYPNGQCQIIFE